MVKESSIIWKDIPGYEGIYQISNSGIVRNLCNGKILKGSVKLTGYKEVTLTKNKQAKSIRIHRLVAEIFIPNPENLKTVNHKDENKENNCVDNLEWLSQKDNNNYGTRNERISKFRKNNQFGEKNPNAVKVLNLTTGEIFNSVRDAAKKYNCNPATISSACNPLDRHHKYFIKGCKWAWLKPVN